MSGSRSTSAGTRSVRSVQRESPAGAPCTLAGAVEVLRLLAREAPAHELNTALDALRAQARDDRSQVEAEALHAAATTLLQSRREDRRRATALHALNESAADLATHRDLDTLLRATCRRARLLLGSDVAYVTLLDPEAAETYVRATDGIVSQSFMSMRTPVGAGLGGLVAETGRPETTADYATDTRLVHLREIDERVAAEGLRAILAVPLQRAEENFGVLLAASRVVHHFTPEAVALCASLGAHAAIAIENARLLEDSRIALADLEQAHALAQAHATRMQRLARAQERLAGVALHGRGLQDLLDEAAACVGGRVELIGPEGEPLARAGTARDDAPHRFTAPMGGGGDLGSVGVRTTATLGIEQEVADRVAGFATSIVLQQRVQSEAAYRHQSRMLEELLAGRRAVDAELERWLTRPGVASTEPHVILVIAADPASERWRWLRLARAAAAERGLVGTFAGRVVVIVPGDDADATAERWSEVMRSAGASSPTIGAAKSHSGILGVPAAYRDAHGALSLLLAMDRHGHRATTAQLGVLGHMLGDPGRAELPRFIERTLGPLITHDAGSRSPLLPVLAAFFEESGHLGHTAGRLKVHINTLYLRLERLDELLGEDWRTPDRLLELHLATRLRALDRALEGQQSDPASPSSPLPSEAK